MYRQKARVVLPANVADADRAVWHSVYDERDKEVLRQRIAIPLDEILRDGGPRPIRVNNAPLPPQPSSRAGSDPFRDDAPTAQAPAAGAASPPTPTFRAAEPETDAAIPAEPPAAPPATTEPEENVF
jgi:hypothetical protein